MAAWRRRLRRATRSLARRATRWFRALGWRRALAVVLVAAAAVGLAARWAWRQAAPPERPPRTSEDICSVLREKPHWYAATRAAAAESQVAEGILLAIIETESRFEGGARPPRRRLLGVVPWRHVSTASGYAQALDGAWGEFEAHLGRPARRTRFDDSVRFVGWYLERARRRLGLGDDVAGLYLAYHEGIAGYRSGRWRGKQSLRRLATRVAARSGYMQERLEQCRRELTLRLVARRAARLLAVVAWALLVLGLWRSGGPGARRRRGRRRRRRRRS